MTGTVNVCIAMGSNMGDRLKHLQMASEQLGDLPDTTLTACSQWLETDPVGPIEQGAFLNGAAVIQTLRRRTAQRERRRALFLSLNHFQIRSQFDSLFIARASARALSNRTPGWYGNAG